MNISCVVNGDVFAMVVAHLRVPDQSSGLLIALIPSAKRCDIVVSTRVSYSSVPSGWSSRR